MGNLKWAAEAGRDQAETRNPGKKTQTYRTFASPSLPSTFHDSRGTFFAPFSGYSRGTFIGTFIAAPLSAPLSRHLYRHLYRSTFIATFIAAPLSPPLSQHLYRSTFIAAPLSPMERGAWPERALPAAPSVSSKSSSSSGTRRG